MQKKSVNSVDEAKQKLANYCVYRDRCHHEVEQKMQEYNLIEEAKNQIVLFLIEHNFLNEERFAKSYARGKFYQNGWGKAKIKAGLKLKKINEKLISIALKEIDSNDYYSFLEKKIIEFLQKLENENHFKKIQKTKTYFYQKGFEMQLINEILVDMV